MLINGALKVSELHKYKFKKPKTYLPKPLSEGHLYLSSLQKSVERLLLLAKKLSEPERLVGGRENTPAHPLILCFCHDTFAAFYCATGLQKPTLGMSFWPLDTENASSNPSSKGIPKRNQPLGEAVGLMK